MALSDSNLIIQMQTRVREEKSNSDLFISRGY
jgi:hypothetical protein